MLPSAPGDDVMSADSAGVAAAARAPPAAAIASTAGRRAKQPRFRSKKPPDAPRRPLSAYNLFFQSERAKLMEEQQARLIEEGEAREGPDFAAPEKPAKIAFDRLAKIISKRWKEISTEELKIYQEKAELEQQRYRKAVEEYKKEKAKEAAEATAHAVATMTDVQAVSGAPLPSSFMHGQVTQRFPGSEAIPTQMPLMSDLQQMLMFQQQAMMQPNDGSGLLPHPPMLPFNPQATMPMAAAQWTSQAAQPTSLMPQLFDSNMAQRQLSLAPLQQQPFSADMFSYFQNAMPQSYPLPQAFVTGNMPTFQPGLAEGSMPSSSGQEIEDQTNDTQDMGNTFSSGQG